MLTVPWQNHFTPSMTRMRQRGRPILDLPEGSVRGRILEEPQTVLEVEEEVEVDQETSQEVAHPPGQGQDQEVVRRDIHPVKEEVEQEIGMAPLEEETAATLKAMTAALQEAGQEQEEASLSIHLARVDHLEEEAPVVRDKEEEVVERIHRHNPTITEDRRDLAAAVEVKEDHEEDQEGHQEEAEQDRSRMGLLDPPLDPLEASVGITRLWAPLGSGAKATSGLTACSPVTRGRRSTGRRTTTPG